MVTIGTVLAVVAAAIAVGVPGICSAIGLKSAGISGAGAVAEDNKNFRNALVLQALPQTQTIYGFIVAIFIVMGAGLLGDPKAVPLESGLVFIASSLIMAFTGVSAIFQGSVSASGISASAKNKKAFVPGIIFSGQVETPAIFGFIISLIVLVVGLGVLA
ncbi:MAG: V-type ATP synthase subunit K [Nanoarchaeota archaeon]